MSIIEHPFHVSPKPLQYVPNTSSNKNKNAKKSKQFSHRRSLSKSKSLSSLHSKYSESAQLSKQNAEQQQQDKATQKEKEYQKFEKILSAANDGDFQDVDLKNSLANNHASNLIENEVDDLKKLHDSLHQQSRSLKLRSSNSNLRVSTNSSVSLSLLGSPSLAVPKKFHNGGSIGENSSSSSVNNFTGLVSRNSSVSSLTNNASFVRGLGINKNQIRRPSDNLTNLKTHGSSEKSFDSKSDSVPSSLASVTECEVEDSNNINNDVTNSNSRRIEEQITIPNALSRPSFNQMKLVSVSGKPFNKPNAYKPNARPFSDDSMISSTSTSSNFEFESEFDSRISSLTSVENVSQISSPEDHPQAMYHHNHHNNQEKTPTPDYINSKPKKNDNQQFENSNAEKYPAHQIHDSDQTPRRQRNNPHDTSFSPSSQDVNDTLTINNSTTTINSSNTIQEIGSGEFDYLAASFTSQLSLNNKPGITSKLSSNAHGHAAPNSDATTKQNTLMNSQSLNRANTQNDNFGRIRSSSGASPAIKQLNRVSSLPTLPPRSPLIGSGNGNNNRSEHFDKRTASGFNGTGRFQSLQNLSMARRGSAFTGTSYSHSSAGSAGIGLGINPMLGASTSTVGSVTSSSPQGSSISSLGGGNGLSGADSVVSPGQRFKLRRQLSKKNLQAFRTEISRINTKDEIIDMNDGIPDSIFFNIPYASGSAVTLFQSNSGHKSKSKNSSFKQVMNDSQTAIPISPLINNNAERDGDFANNLSKFYTDASDNYVANELAKREENHSKLPSYIINQLEVQSSICSLSPRSSVSFESKLSNGSSQAASAMYSNDTLSNNGSEILSPSSIINSPLSQTSNYTIDELRMLSPEKLEHLSSTRPMWLPPKSSHESQKHQQQISEVIESFSKKEIDKKEKNFQKLKGLLINNQKWFEVTVKHQEIHRPVIHTMRHLCWKSNIPNDLRFKIWHDVLNYYNKKNGFDVVDDSSNSKSQQPELFEALKEKLDGINTEYLEPEIELIVSSIYPNMQLFQKGQELYPALKQLLLFKKISTSGLQYGDEALLGLFLLYFTPQESFNLLNLVKKNVINDEFTTKFNSNVSSNYVMTKYLSKHFKDEIPLINTRNMYKIFMKFDPELLIKIFDHLVLNNSYKVCYCMVLVVLKFYHFGFLDLKQLSLDDGMIIDIDNHEEFIEKFTYYYKKF